MSINQERALLSFYIKQINLRFEFVPQLSATTLTRAIYGNPRGTTNRNQGSQKVVNFFPVNLQTEEREAVAIPLPVSMHTGQIILLTKALAKMDLVFYDFSTGKPVHTWINAEPASS